MRTDIRVAYAHQFVFALRRKKLIVKFAWDEVERRLRPFADLDEDPMRAAARERPELVPVALRFTELRSDNGLLTLRTQFRFKLYPCLPAEEATLYIGFAGTCKVLNASEMEEGFRVLALNGRDLTLQPLP